MSGVRLVIRGYVPRSQNRLRGCHWSVLHREKRRAAIALRNALATEYNSLCTPYDPSTGTTTGSKTFRTALSKLDSYLATIGEFSTALSSLEKQVPEPRKERK